MAVGALLCTELVEARSACAAGSAVLPMFAPTTGGPVNGSRRVGELGAIRRCVGRLRGPIAAWLSLMVVALGGPLLAQRQVPNPYGHGVQWGILPEGRSWGSTSAIYPHRDPDGRFTGSVWVAERCAGSNCRTSDLDPILLFDANGNLVRSFGSGMFIWPHGIHADHEGNVWVTDAVHSYCRTGNEGGKGHQVHKFGPGGEVLMSLGTAGVAGEGANLFSCPSDVVVAPNGDIFVGDGHNHGDGGNNRIVRFDKSGKFLGAWGQRGTGPGEFQGIHALAMDSQGRLFVGDRANQRIQVLGSDGSHVATWKQFGSPSGIFIDADDRIFVADSDSGFDPGGTGNPRNLGYERGIYIGDARTGKLEAFIPDPEPDLSNVTSGAEGVLSLGGSVLGAQVGGSRGVLRYSRRR